MNDPGAWGKFGDCRHTRILAPRIDIDGNAQLTEVSAQLTDVDIHPTRFATAQRGERAAMHAEHGDTT
jgi:hypothetical protein